MEAPRGRQRPKHVLIKQVTRSVAPLGLIIVLQPYPGGSSLRSGAGGVHPVCGLSRLDFVDLWFGAYLADSINWKYRCPVKLFHHLLHPSNHRYLVQNMLGRGFGRPEEEESCPGLTAFWPYRPYLPNTNKLGNQFDFPFPSFPLDGSCATLCQMPENLRQDFASPRG